MMWNTVCTVTLCFVGVWLGAQCHPGRPTIPDDPIARAIFMVAEGNRTPDGFLTADEMSDIFLKFDINGDGAIDETEFIAHWSILRLGDLDHAIKLFHHADTNRDGRISRDPDYTRLFYYFDRDFDGKISEAEFVSVWFSLST